MTSRAILIIDDHALVREGIRLLLGRLAGEVRVLEAGSLAGARASLTREPLDLVILDYHLPDAVGAEAVDVIASSCPGVPVVVLSADDDGALARTLLDTGVRGYIPKASTSEVMLAALELVLQGGTYVPPTVLAPRSNAQDDTLTARQREVLELVAGGLANKEIAHAIGMSESTVRAHMTNIFRALGVRNRTQAVQVSIQRRLLHPRKVDPRG